MDSLPVFLFISGIKSSRACAQHQEHVGKPGVRCSHHSRGTSSFRRVSNSVWVIQDSLLSPQSAQSCQKMPKEEGNKRKKIRTAKQEEQNRPRTGILWSQIQVFLQFFFISLAGSSFRTNCGSSTKESSWLQPNRISAGWGAAGNWDYSIPHCSLGAVRDPGIPKKIPDSSPWQLLRSSHSSLLAHNPRKEGGKSKFLVKSRP